MKAVAGKITAMAREGDPQALQLWLQWFMGGQPSEAVDPDLVRQGELRRLTDLPRPEELHKRMSNRLRPDLALVLAAGLLDAYQTFTAGDLLGSPGLALAVEQALHDAGRSDLVRSAKLFIELQEKLGQLEDEAQARLDEEERRRLLLAPKTP